MDIIKVRLHKTKKGNGLVLTYKKKDNSDDVDGTETHKAPIHKDCQDAIDALAIHLAVLTGYVNASKVEDIAEPAYELSDKFHINGYSLGGDADQGTDGVVISGHRTEGGHATILNSPFRKFDEAPTSRYTFMDDLRARVNVIESEIAQYLDGTKRGAPLQPELPYQDEKVTNMQIAEPIDPRNADPEAMARVAAMDNEPKNKRGGKKKVQQTADTPSGEAVES